MALYLPGISSLPATDRDESRYMQATRQMVETGDMLDIRFQDDSRYKKPVGIYWLQAGISHVAQSLGVPSTERIPYRLPSTIGATGAVLLLYLGFRHLIGEGAAFVAAVFLACSLLLGVEAHLAKTDAMQLAAIVAMQAGLAQIYVQPRQEGLWRSRLLFWLGLGLGMLIKGPVAPAVATFTLAWICWKERSLWPAKALHPLPWLALPVLILGPWLLSIQMLSQGQFIKDSFGNDFIAKLLEVQESHGAPPGTYLLITPLLLWPVSWLLIPQAWAGLRRAPAQLKAITRLASAWLVPGWIVFELVPTKLPHYVLPLLPALCLLAGMGLIHTGQQGRGAKGLSAWPQRIGVTAWILSGSLLAVGVPTIYFWASGTISELALLVSALCIATLVLMPKLTDFRQRLLASAAAAVVIFGLMFQLILPRLTPIWPAERLRQIIIAEGAQSLPVAIAQYHEPSVVFNLGTETQLTNLEGLISHAVSHSEAIVIIRSNQMPVFRKKLPVEITTKRIGQFHGLNYSKGRKLALDVVRTRKL
ncbi:glycosyltransferase family 39 protein [Cyanobium sp. HWJ4-Hawea]|nr:glycosyltransferase family 39 protein [Cyanobium sp. HWJ4-Hawea]